MEEIPSLDELVVILNSQSEAKRTHDQLMCEHAWSRYEEAGFTHKSGGPELMLAMISCDLCGAWKACRTIPEDQLLDEGWTVTKDN